MNEENKIPEIHLELTEVKIEAKNSKIAFKYYLQHDYCQIWTNNWLVYIFYKILWKIKPPELKCYYDPSIEKDLEKMIV